MYIPEDVNSLEGDGLIRLPGGESRSAENNIHFTIGHSETEPLDVLPSETRQSISAADDEQLEKVLSSYKGHNCEEGTNH